MLVLRGEFGLAKKLRSTSDNSPALPESLPDFNGCPSVNHDSEKEKSIHKKQMKSFGWKEQKEQNKGNINCLQCGEYYKDEIVNFV